ncbi:MAG: 2-oxo acid dehydrogenase subunit E2 [Planctomycetaceae bacterium]|nr:2-oxo acid dehydrogenase subunit E2 [Planctomycetaceae bacterium]
MNLPPDPRHVPYKGIRKLIGSRMHASMSSQAQLTLNTSADAVGLLRVRKRAKEQAAMLGLPNITLNDLVCWTVAQTLPRFPDVNAVFEDEAQRIAQFTRVNLGVAVDTPRGLTVATVRDAQDMALADLAGTLARYVEECRSGSIDMDLLSGGTFTVTNLGSLGIETFTPIVNIPQAAILGVCAIRDAASTDEEGGATVRPRIGLSLTIDHRVVDGAPGSRFLQELVKGLERIEETTRPVFAK